MLLNYIKNTIISQRLRKREDRRKYLLQFWSDTEVDEMIKEEFPPEYFFVDQTASSQWSHTIVLASIPLSGVYAVKNTSSAAELTILMTVYIVFSFFLSLAVGAWLSRNKSINQARDELAKEYVSRNPEKYTMGRAKNFTKNLIQFQDRENPSNLTKIKGEGAKTKAAAA